MKCVRCGVKLPEGELKCNRCGASHILRCLDCAHIVQFYSELCSDCGGQMLAVWNPTIDELIDLGFHCFMPFTGDRIFDVYLGGNPDGGGYNFRNRAGYTGPSHETIVLPSMVEGVPIIGIWNEFFCTGDDFDPRVYDKTFERMYPIKKIVVSEGIREAGIFAFFGCCGLETLFMPLSMKKMMYDFADIFPNGMNPYPNGKPRGPLTICYRGSREDWAKVAVPNIFYDILDKGYIKLKFNCTYSNIGDKGAN